MLSDEKSTGRRNQGWLFFFYSFLSQQAATSYEPVLLVLGGNRPYVFYRITDILTILTTSSITCLNLCKFSRLEFSE